MVLLAMATRAKHLKTASSVPVPGGWDEEQSGQASEGGPIVKIKSVRLEWLMVLSCPRLMNKPRKEKKKKKEPQTSSMPQDHDHRRDRGEPSWHGDPDDRQKSQKRST